MRKACYLILEEHVIREIGYKSRWWARCNLKNMCVKFDLSELVDLL